MSVGLERQASRSADNDLVRELVDRIVEDSEMISDGVRAGVIGAIVPSATQAFLRSISTLGVTIATP
jgi:hypothetical protein